MIAYGYEGQGKGGQASHQESPVGHTDPVGIVLQPSLQHPCSYAASGCQFFQRDIEKPSAPLDPSPVPPVADPSAVMQLFQKKYTWTQ